MNQLSSTTKTADQALPFPLTEIDLMSGPTLFSDSIKEKIRKVLHKTDRELSSDDTEFLETLIDEALYHELIEIKFTHEEAKNVAITALRVANFSEKDSGGIHRNKFDNLLADAVKNENVTAKPCLMELISDRNFLPSLVLERSYGTVQNWPDRMRGLTLYANADEDNKPLSMIDNIRTVKRIFLSINHGDFTSLDLSTLYNLVRPDGPPEFSPNTQSIYT